MRNLSAYCLPPSDIDKDRDVSAYSTDFAELGIPDQSPFDILSRPKAVPKQLTAPKKRGPKRNCISKTLASLRDTNSNNFNVPIMSREESDRTS